jgi:hypothetical protein
MIETVTAVMGLVSAGIFWHMHLKAIVPGLEFLNGRRSGIGPGA